MRKIVLKIYKVLDYIVCILLIFTYIYVIIDYVKDIVNFRANVLIIFMSFY